MGHYDVRKNEIVEGWQRFGKFIVSIEIAPADRARVRQDAMAVIAKQRSQDLRYLPPNESQMQ